MIDNTLTKPDFDNFGHFTSQAQESDATWLTEAYLESSQHNQTAASLDDSQPTQRRLERQELVFIQLVNLLLEYEQAFGYSTIEMCHRYLSGDFDEEDGRFERWFDLFFLFLGTPEVKHYACP